MYQFYCAWWRACSNGVKPKSIKLRALSGDGDGAFRHVDKIEGMSVENAKHYREEFKSIQIFGLVA